MGLGGKVFQDADRRGHAGSAGDQHQGVVAAVSTTTSPKGESDL
jgi:hypothetical protein